MAKSKEKRNWKNVHKIRVHENRWLIWTIAISVLVLSAVIAYIQISGITFEIQMGYDHTPPVGYLSFRNNSEGYSIRYPKDWSIESEGDSRMSFVDESDVDQYFSVLVYPATEERQIRTSLKATGVEREAMIAGLPATIYIQMIDQSEKVALVKEDDSIYVLRGKGSSFEWIVSTFRFNQEIE